MPEFKLPVKTLQRIQRLKVKAQRAFEEYGNVVAEVDLQLRSAAKRIRAAHERVYEVREELNELSSDIYSAADLQGPEDLVEEEAALETLGSVSDGDEAHLGDLEEIEGALSAAQELIGAEVEAAQNGSVDTISALEGIPEVLAIKDQED